MHGQLFRDQIVMATSANTANQPITDQNLNCTSGTPGGSLYLEISDALVLRLVNGRDFQIKVPSIWAFSDCGHTCSIAVDLQPQPHIVVPAYRVQANPLGRDGSLEEVVLHSVSVRVTNESLYGKVHGAKF